MWAPYKSLRRSKAENGCCHVPWLQNEAQAISAEQAGQVRGGAAAGPRRAALPPPAGCPAHECQPLLAMLQAMEQRYTALAEGHGRVVAEKERLQREAEASREASLSSCQYARRSWGT